MSKRTAAVAAAEEAAKASLTPMQLERLDYLLRLERDTIRALADALWLAGEEAGDGEWHTNTCWRERHDTGACTEICAERRIALRLAGRLP